MTADAVKTDEKQNYDCSGQRSNQDFQQSFTVPHQHTNIISNYELNEMLFFSHPHFKRSWIVIFLICREVFFTFFYKTLSPLGEKHVSVNLRKNFR